MQTVKTWSRGEVLSLPEFLVKLLDKGYHIDTVTPIHMQGTTTLVTIIVSKTPVRTGPR